MVAEDSLISMTVIKNQIQNLGLQNRTSFFTNGQELINKVESILAQPLASDRPISIILTDFQMPKKNGIQVLTAVRKMFARKAKELGYALHLPKVVFLTAYISNNFKSHLKGMGQHEIYEKPLLGSQLR